MLKYLNKNRISPQRRCLVFGQTHVVVYIPKPEDQDGGLETHLMFTITRDRKDTSKFFICTHESMPRSSGGGNSYVVHAGDWTMIDFSDPGYEEHSVVVMIDSDGTDYFLTYQDAAAWDQKNGQSFAV